MQARQVLLWLFFAMPLSLFSQAMVKGVVVDENSYPVADAAIWVKDFSLRTTSDSLGNFEIFVPPNKLLIANKDGYFIISQRISSTTTLPVTLRLRKKQHTDYTILVRGTVMDYAEKEPIIGATVFSKELGTQTLTDINGQFELDVYLGSTIQITYGRTESYLIEYGGEQVFELFKPVSITEVGNQPTLQSSHFNKGNIHHPLQLIQAKVAGMTMSSGGGNDPFAQFHTRLHGLSSLNGAIPASDFIYTTADPLLVVDGMPETDISILAPLSIQSIKVIKDGTAARYGIRGASGVIEITTNRPNFSGLQYHTFLGIDQLQQTLSFLDAETYRQQTRGAVDLGATTDWLKEISRPAYTHTHQLSLAKQHKSGAYRFALLYKDAKGILKKQGYQSVQGNGYFKQTALDGKIQLEAIVRGNIQEDRYSQPAAFRYAQSYNPTAPIFKEDNPDLGFFEQEIEDAFNPIAIIEQNPSEGEQRQLFTKLSTTYQPSPVFALVGAYSMDSYQTERGQFFSKDSFWRGRDRNGLAIQEQLTQNQHFLATKLVLTPFATALKKLTLGHEYQIQERQYLALEGGDFLTNAFSFNNLGAARDFLNGNGRIQSNQSRHRLAAFYGEMDFNWNQRVLLQVGMRIEGSSRLGSNRQWGRFPFLAFTHRLGKPAGDFFWEQNIQVKGSYGVTGNLPYTDYLNIRRYGRQGLVFDNGEYTDIYGIAFDDNPELTWETKREWSIGIHTQPAIFNRTITFSIDYYNNTVDDIIQTVRNGLGRLFMDNVISIKNRGWELSLKMDLLQNRHINWQTSLLVSSNKSFLANYAGGTRSNFRNFPNQRLPYVPASGGQWNDSSVLIENGSEIGDFLFLQYKDISSDGRWHFEDLNQNDVEDDLTDKTIVGNGLPNWTLGWNNTVEFRNFKLDLFFRGAFGHDLFNLTRQLTENPSLLPSYNVLSSTFQGESARLTAPPRASSFYVENASFIKLDNLQLSYTLNAAKKLPFHSFQVYVAANNLFTLTNYKGWNPDYRLQSGNDVLAIGYEFQDGYLPTRSWVMGVQIGIR